MKFKRHGINKFLKAFLFSFSLLMCLNLLFMYILYLQTQPLRGYIPRPNLKTLLRVYEETQLYYADVQNHVWLIEQGYEKIDTKSTDFDFGERRINWAYHPLSPALGKLLSFMIKSPFWSLCVLNQIVLLLIFTGFSYWSTTYITRNEMRLLAWLILLFFIIPPIGYFANFIMIPAVLIGIVFFSYRHWLKSPEEKQTAFWILVISCFLLGFTRFQGLLVNAACILLTFIIIIWYKKPLEKLKAAILILANILPLLITMGIFKYYANDPFAWAKIQEAWGVASRFPWFPIVRYWESGIVFNLQNDDLFFSYFRTLVFLFFIILAAKKIVFEKNFIRDFIHRCYSHSFINLYFVTVSLGLSVLIYCTDLMVGNHRLATMAYLGVLIWLEQHGKVSRFIIIFFLFVRAVEFALFFQGVLAFTW